ncbi:uncharacterized protein LOC134802677 [Cydia splendana]|uniref:uncharacterized protein LOC134802677 n=1 Tax=Cydia splendana TaxID=1100963 RepID=UPI00300C70FC
MRNGDSRMTERNRMTEIGSSAYGFVVTKSAFQVWRTLVTTGQVGPPTSERGPAPGEHAAPRSLGDDVSSDSDAVRAEDDDDIAIVEKTLVTIDLSEDIREEDKTKKVVSTKGKAAASSKTEGHGHETGEKDEIMIVENATANTSDNRTVLLQKRKSSKHGNKPDKNHPACSKCKKVAKQIDKTIDKNKEIVDLDAPSPPTDVLEALQDLDVNNFETTIVFDSDDEDVRPNVDKKSEVSNEPNEDSVPSTNDNESQMNEKAEKRHQRASSDSSNGNLVIDDDANIESESSNSDSEDKTLRRSNMKYNIYDKKRFHEYYPNAKKKVKRRTKISEVTVSDLIKEVTGKTNDVEENAESSSDDGSRSSDSSGGKEREMGEEEGSIDPKLLMYAVVLLERIDVCSPRPVSRVSSKSPSTTTPRSSSPESLPIKTEPILSLSRSPIRDTSSPVPPMPERASSPLLSRISPPPPLGPSPVLSKITTTPPLGPCPVLSKITTTPPLGPCPVLSKITTTPPLGPSAVLSKITPPPPLGPCPVLSKITTTPPLGPSPVLSKITPPTHPPPPPSPLFTRTSPPPLSILKPDPHPDSLFHFFATTLPPKFVFYKNNIPLLRMCKFCSVVLQRIDLTDKGKMGNRVAKKVELPDIEEVRRNNRSMLTAQVAPRRARRTSGSTPSPSSGSDSDWTPDASDSSAVRRAQRRTGESGSDSRTQRHNTDESSSDSRATQRRDTESDSDEGLQRASQRRTADGSMFGVWRRRQRVKEAELQRMLDNLAGIDGDKDCDHIKSTSMRGPAAAVLSSNCARCAARVLSAPPISGHEARLQRQLLRRAARMARTPTRPRGAPAAPAAAPRRAHGQDTHGESHTARVLAAPPGSMARTPTVSLIQRACWPRRRAAWPGHPRARAGRAAGQHGQDTHGESHTARVLAAPPGSMARTPTVSLIQRACWPRHAHGQDTHARVLAAPPGSMARTPTVSLIQRACWPRRAHGQDTHGESHTARVLAAPPGSMARTPTVSLIQRACWPRRRAAWPGHPRARAGRAAGQHGQDTHGESHTARVLAAPPGSMARTPTVSLIQRACWPRRAHGQDTHARVLAAPPGSMARTPTVSLIQRACWPRRAHGQDTHGESHTARVLAAPPGSMARTPTVSLIQRACWPRRRAAWPGHPRARAGRAAGQHGQDTHGESHTARVLAAPPGSMARTPTAFPATTSTATTPAAAVPTTAPAVTTAAVSTTAAVYTAAAVSTTAAVSTAAAVTTATPTVVMTKAPEIIHRAKKSKKRPHSPSLPPRPRSPPSPVDPEAAAREWLRQKNIAAEKFGIKPRSYKKIAPVVQDSAPATIQPIDASSDTVPKPPQQSNEITILLTSNTEGAAVMPLTEENLARHTGQVFRTAPSSTTPTLFNPSAVADINKKLGALAPTKTLDFLPILKPANTDKLQTTNANVGFRPVITTTRINDDFRPVITNVQSLASLPKTTVKIVPRDMPDLNKPEVFAVVNKKDPKASKNIIIIPSARNPPKKQEEAKTKENTENLPQLVNVSGGVHLPPSSVGQGLHLVVSQSPQKHTILNFQPSISQKNYIPNIVVSGSMIQGVETRPKFTNNSRPNLVTSMSQRPPLILNSVLAGQSSQQQFTLLNSTQVRAVPRSSTVVTTSQPNVLFSSMPGHTMNSTPMVVRSVQAGPTGAPSAPPPWARAQPSNSTPAQPPNSPPALPPNPPPAQPPNPPPAQPPWLRAQPPNSPPAEPPKPLLTQPSANPTPEEEDTSKDGEIVMSSCLEFCQRPQASSTWCEGRDSTSLVVLCTAAAEEGVWYIKTGVQQWYLLVCDEEKPPAEAEYWALRPRVRLALPGNEGNNEGEGDPAAKRLKMSDSDSNPAPEAAPAVKTSYLKVKAFARMMPDPEKARKVATGPREAEAARPREAEAKKLLAPARVYVNNMIYQKMSDDPLFYAKVLVAVPSTAACRALLARGAPLQIYCLQTGKLYPLEAESKKDVSRITLTGDEEVSGALVALAKLLFRPDGRGGTAQLVRCAAACSAHMFADYLRPAAPEDTFRLVEKIKEIRDEK